MKLSSEQHQEIEAYLNYYNLYQLDIRQEVFDHMVEGIQETMQSEAISFGKALELETVKWAPDLKEHSSWLLGWAWNGPKIMIEKAVKWVVEAYKKVLLFALSITLITYVKPISVSAFFQEIINISIGVVYFLILFTLLLMEWKLSKDKMKSSYQFLLKINAVGFSFLYLVYNPILSESFYLVKEGSISVWMVFAHSSFLSYGFLFLKLYQKHQDTCKTLLL